jgi:hypothetical protein
LLKPDFPSGEVFVLDDGGEADLDLGNYERYLNVTLGRDNNITTGKIYREVIEKEVRFFVGVAKAPRISVLTSTAFALCRGAETISERPCRSSLTLPTLSRTGSSAFPRSLSTSRASLLMSASLR